ncbi:Ig-like domain-containing protein [Marinobacter sp. KMM 10035]|uniref:Ig-like domain-containing protein n=1 Tax=Marinobacter sp. KMM 10035 TaxID=3134034 RepID=UPI00397919DB
MRKLKTLALVPAILLAACGGDEQSVKERATPGSLVYSYPTDGQADVSPKADIVLRFSHAIVDDETDIADKIELASSGSVPAFTVKKIDGGKSLKLEIADGQKLGSRAGYSLTFNAPLNAEGGRLVDTPNAVGDEGIQFNTRGELSGIAGLANTSDTFGVAWQVPDTEGLFQVMNFSTFRLAMTQPVHPEWQTLGGSIELLDKDGEAVPATVLVKGNRITVDPCLTEQKIDCGSRADVLSAGQTYTLKLDSIASLTNGPDGTRYSEEFSFTPRATGPTAVLAQDAIDSIDGRYSSILNGQAINGVVLNSVLQGVTDSSQQTGSLFAELGHAPSFAADEAIPLRIPKGSVLESTSLSIKVGGTVQALNIDDGSPQETGTIKVTMLSDASGYMTPNSYTNEKTAPRHITLFMDVSMNTEEKMPNAALSQDLMGVELRGIVRVKDGVLTIDAIGMVEPNLLGQEYTDSTIAFHLQANMDGKGLDAADEWEATRDQTPPQLVSWMPGAEDAKPATRQSMHRPGDPIILFFDEPLDPASISAGVNLYADGQELTVANGTLNTALDGTALTLNPEGGLKPGVQYRVSAPGLIDLAGNPFVLADDLSFSLDGQRDVLANAPPLALTTYPGYPCETDHTQLDLEAGVLGKCWTAKDNRGDVLPVSKMPGDRPITVVFSQPMDLDSIRLNETFIVQKVDSDGNDVEPITGRLEKNNQRVRFYPDQPWEVGAFYQYTLISRRGDDSTAGSAYSNYCDMSVPQSICGANAYPLKADLLEGLNGGWGNGEDPYNPMKIYFEGAEAKDSVFTALRNLPIRDTNANFNIDCGSNDDPDCLEPFVHEYKDPAEVADSTHVSGWLPSANSTKLSVVNNKAKLTALGIPSQIPARVGCKNDERCPKDKFIYQTYALNSEVIGPGTWTDPATGTEEDAILVELYPTLLATSSIDTYVDLGILEADVPTNTQIIRMRYSEDPSCAGQNGCPRNQLIKGAIVTVDGKPVFKTRAELMLDAPEMKITANGPHDLYARPFYFDLEGDVTFFDDGRMQIEQRNTNLVDIKVEAKPLGLIIDLPLQIPVGGTYLNFITNPVKDLPSVQ